MDFDTMPQIIGQPSLIRECLEKIHCNGEIPDCFAEVINTDTLRVYGSNLSKTAAVFSDIKLSHNEEGVAMLEFSGDGEFVIPLGAVIGRLKSKFGKEPHVDIIFDEKRVTIKGMMNQTSMANIDPHNIVRPPFTTIEQNEDGMAVRRNHSGEIVSVTDIDITLPSEDVISGFNDLKYNTNLDVVIFNLAPEGSEIQVGGLAENDPKDITFLPDVAVESATSIAVNKNVKEYITQTSGNMTFQTKIDAGFVVFMWECEEMNWKMLTTTVNID